MPEVGFSKETKQAAEEIKEEYYDIDGRWTKLAEQFDAEYVGSGAECVVLSSHRGASMSGEEGLVAAFTYNDMEPKEMKRIFYAQRIMSTLFPHNFPKFYAAFGKHPEKDDPRNVSGTIRERIEQGRKKKNKYGFSKVRQVVDKLDLPFYFDYFYDNFKVGKDGGEYYVDVVYAGGTADDLGAGRQSLARYMEENKYSLRQREIVDKSMRRLAELSEEKTD